MRLGIDLDDVLADFIPVFRKRCQELFGRPHEDVWPCDWEWSNFELTPAELNCVWANIAGEADFHLNLPVKAGTDLLLHLDCTDHELFYITARRNGAGAFSARWQTAHWLKRNFAIQYPTVLVTRDKIPLINALQLDAFIDDRADTCEAIRDKTQCTPYLLRAPHNEHCRADIERVEEFNEFARKFL